MTVSPNMIAMNKYDTQLRDLIHVEKGIIPANLCDYLVEAIEKNEWRPHTWYNNVQGTFGSEETMELDCLLYTSPSPRDKRQSRMPSSA